MLEDTDDHFIVEDIRIGLLTFKAVIKDARGKKKGVLLQCDCGRYVTIHTKVLWEVKYGRVKDIPWSCERCDYTKPSAGSYRPWSNPPRKPAPKLPVVNALLGTCDKTLHGKEWFAWQQAKRISKGVISRWMDFKLFYKDMGPAPRGARLAKKKSRLPHSPSNSYWSVPLDFHWHGTPVTAKWITQTHGVPKHYLVECRRAKFLEVEAVMTRYRSGKPAPKLGVEDPPPDLCPMHVG